MAEEINFLTHQKKKKKKKNEKNFIIRILFSFKLSNREEGNLPFRLKENTNSKNMSESCLHDEIPECSCVNGPIKSDIALYISKKQKQIITDKTQMKTQTIYRSLQ